MKTKRNELYKCEHCGNIVCVMHEGAKALVCCGKKMDFLIENTTEAATEKHIPIIEKINGGFKVTVGEIEHPMVEAHHIEWIELFAGNKVFTKFLKVNEKPTAIFTTTEKEVTARAYCNLHGNWKSVI